MNYEDLYREIPVVVSVTLYNYNYIDNRIISEIKNNSYIINKSEKLFNFS